MYVTQFLFLSAFLFCVGIYGVLARRNGVLVLMSVELMLNAVNLNLVAFAAKLGNVAGQVFALFVITIAAAEVGVGLAIVLLIYRNRVGVSAVGASFVLSLGVATDWTAHEQVVSRHWDWFTFGGRRFDIGLHVDGVTVMM